MKRRAVFYGTYFVAGLACYLFLVMEFKGPARGQPDGLRIGLIAIVGGVSNVVGLIFALFVRRIAGQFSDRRNTSQRPPEI